MYFLICNLATWFYFWTAFIVLFPVVTWIYLLRTYLNPLPLILNSGAIPKTCNSLLVKYMFHVTSYLAFFLVGSGSPQKSAGAPGWLSQLSVWLLISTQVMIPGLWARALSQTPCAWCLRFCLPLSLSPCHSLLLHLKIKKERKRKKVFQLQSQVVL